MSLFTFYFLELTAIYIILAWGTYLLFRANQVYFGPIYCMCLGAYISGYAARDLGLPFGLAIFIAMLVCMLFSLIFTHRLAKLPGFPMMLATTALVFIVQTVIRNLSFLGGSQGFFGIPYVPKYTLLAVTYGVTIIVAFLIYRLDHSHIGRAMDAIRFDPKVASTMGVDTTKLSVQLQLIASALGGIAGGFYAFTLGNIAPSSFSFSTIVNVVAIVILGGMHTMWGIIIVAPVVFAISHFVPAGFANIVYALLLIIVLIVRPNGLIDRKIIRFIGTLCQGVIRRITHRETRTDL